MRSLVCLVAGALLGCATIDPAVLPEAPIAFVFRTVEETGRLVDEVKAQREAATPPDENEFSVDLERIEKMTGRRTVQDVIRDQQGQLSLYVAPARRLEPLEAAGRGARPLDWSPDHERLMFSAPLRGVPHLFEWVAARGEVHQLTRGRYGETDGCYGPDGAIAWAERDASGATRLWVRFAGERPRPVTPGPADAEPAWAPDGSRLVYTRDDPRAGPSLRWVDPIGGDEGLLGRGRSPTFSPDGQWIVFSARTSRGWRIQRMRSDGSGRRPLGGSGYEEYEPTVSPDGRYVVFAAAKDPTLPLTRLFVRSMDGTLDRQLDVSGSGLLPVW